MTTIAIDKNTIASDSQATGAFIHAKGFTKIYRIKEGNSKGLWGFAGNATNIQAIAHGLREGYPLDTLSPSFFDDVSAVWIDNEGTVTAFADSPIGMEVHVPFSIGSGSQFAIGAMNAGASAKQAVEIAKELDPYTGKDVVVHSYAEIRDVVAEVRDVVTPEDALKWFDWVGEESAKLMGLMPDEKKTAKTYSKLQAAIESCKKFIETQKETEDDFGSERQE